MWSCKDAALTCGLGTLHFFLLPGGGGCIFTEALKLITDCFKRKEGGRGERETHTEREIESDREREKERENKEKNRIFF